MASTTGSHGSVYGAHAPSYLDSSGLGSVSTVGIVSVLNADISCLFGLVLRYLHRSSEHEQTSAFGVSDWSQSQAILSCVACLMTPTM